MDDPAAAPELPVNKVATPEAIVVDGVAIASSPAASLSEPLVNVAPAATEETVVESAKLTEPAAIKTAPPVQAKKRSIGRPTAKAPATRKLGKAKPAARLATPKQAPSTRVSARKAAPAKSSNSRPVPTVIKPKETIVIDSSNNNAQNFVADIQGKANAVLQKGYAVASEVGALTKGNAEACLESGKILANGLKQIGSTYAAGGQAAVAALTGDVKEFSAVKSPVDLFKLQGAIVRRNLKAVFAFGARNGEALFALAKDSSAPVTKQANVVVETVRKVA